MARGVDFKGVQMIVDYDFPQSAVSYMHRIGKKWEDWKTSRAVTFFIENDTPNFRLLTL